MCTCELEKQNLTSLFHEVVESRRGLLDHATERILQLVRAGLGFPMELDDLHLALSEAIANAIIHGNQEDPDKKVQICGGLERGNRLVLVVTDQGLGFDPTRIPDPTSEQNVFASHGRGVFLMQRLMERTEFRLGGRQVALWKRLGAQQTGSCVDAPC
jgi:anti-sigma regulatory factor (Ser/Thr protein kinase)